MDSMRIITPIHRTSLFLVVSVAIGLIHATKAISMSAMGMPEPGALFLGSRSRDREKTGKRDGPLASKMSENATKINRTIQSGGL